jgi:serine/threonine protein kinase
LYLQPRTLLKNQYIIGLPLGQGGFGVTYLGLDQWLQKQVAIKEYLPVTLATRNILNFDIVPLKQQEENFRQGIQFFINEARNLAKFNHPNIVRISNFFEENHTGYMVMDYLAGTHLAAILSQGKKHLSVEAALQIVLPILDALAQVHAQHIYHRDISAQNILILPTGEPILIDFGAARHIVGEYTRSLDLVLKHGYSPLEQYSGKGKIGPWTDIYACGALLYLLITGQLPPAATDRFGGEHLIAPADLGIALSSTVNAAIMHALAVKIEDRLQTVQDFKAALQGKITLSPATRTTASPPSNNYKPYWSAKKIVLGVITSILLLILVWLFYQSEPDLLPTLLTQAQVQWKNNQITQPVGNNAYETYQQILAIAPNHGDAQAGILKIVKHYEQLARNSQQAGNLTNSLAQIKQGLQIRPNYLPLQQLEQQVQQILAKPQPVPVRPHPIKQLLNQANKQLTLLQLDAAYQTYQTVFNLEPNNQLAQAGIKKIAEKYIQLAQAEPETTKKLLFINEGLEKFPHNEKLRVLQQELTPVQPTQPPQVAILLQQATQQLATLHLTTPAGDNAYETYQQILKQVPEHPEAKAGLIKIADQYEQLAQMDRNNIGKNLALINKGLQVFPDHAGLLALQQQMQQQQQRKVITSQPPATSTQLNSATPPPVVSKPAVVPPPWSNAKNNSSPPLPQPAATPAVKPPLPAIPVEKPPAKLSQPSPPLTSKKPTVVPPTHNPVEELLVIAQQHVEANQLEAAYQTYQNILTIAPQNEPAKIGLQQIAHHYEQLARSTSKQGDLEASLLLINKGLSAYPHHQGLLALRAEIKRRLKDKNDSNTQSSPLIFTPSF